MNNINLKSLIIIIVAVSALMIIGSLLIGRSTSKNQFTPAKNVPAVTTQTPKITVTYPSLEASRSSAPLHQPAQIPKLEAVDGGSTSGSGPIPKKIPKP